MMVEPKLRFKADDGSDFPDWEEEMLGELVEIQRGGSPRPISKFITTGEGINWIKIGDAPSHGNCITKVKERIIPEGKAKSREVHKGDLLLSNSMSFGRPYILGVDGCIHDGWLVVHDTNAVFETEFLCGYLGTESVFRQYKRLAAGSAVNNLNKDLVSSVVLGVPSLPEQRKIADLLSAVDDVIAAQEAEVAAWEKRKKGVMQKLFSQEVRFKADDGSDFPDWEEKTLGDICMYERQRSEGANFVGTENMLKDFGGVTFDNSNADGLGTLYHPGDTLMSNIRPYLKKAWLADRKGTCSTDVLVFHPTSVEPGYLYWLIASDAFVRYVMSAAKGSKMPRGDKKHIMEMPLLLPNKDEQRKIDDCLSSLNDVIIKAKNELAKWQELKKGLLQQMFV